MTTFAFSVIAAIAAFIVLERLIGVGMRWGAPLLPDDICGPDGWLVDTKARKGVFD